MFNKTIHDILTATYPPFANWQGVPIQKNPFDLLLYQEAIHETRPTTLIETGSMHGGSALFFADMMELANGPSMPVDVLSIDITPRDFPDDPRLQFLQADSRQATIRPQLEMILKFTSGPVMVVLDAEHSEEAVAAELENLAPLVSRGQWLVIEDTSHTTGIRAVEPFLAAHPEFQPVDQSRYLCTYNTWLRRI